MALAYPTTGTTETQQFGPVSSGTPGYVYQPPMYAYGSTVGWFHPYKGWSFYSHFHNGLDIAGVPTKGLKAMESGKVTFSGWRNNGGGYVMEVEIRPGTKFTFNHCSRLLVKTGAIVTKGQLIAYIGKTGAATGNHCHTSLDILERGPDGIYRWLMWNPKLFMSGQAYANDPRIVSAYAGTAKVPRLSGGIIADEGNIRTTPRQVSGNIFAVTRSGRVRRKSDNADLGPRTARFRWYREVQGDQYTVGGVVGNRYTEFYVGGGKRYIAKPFASKVAWYSK